MPERPAPRPTGHSILDTLQSLVVAFVLAMTFRGFALEGFVIPTGSMAPTLMGRHTLWTSEYTGYTYAVDSYRMISEIEDAARSSSSDAMARVLERPHYTVDPMLGRLQSPDPTLYRNLVNDIRMGDRILVHKLMYPFFEPSRWDVVVFKNPTAPVGDAENFIKRLIGLPREKIWLADGDVFAGPATTGDRLDDFVVQRKPEFVQRAVWQPVHHGEYIPVQPERAGRLWVSPWQGSRWETNGRRDYVCTSADPSELQWDHGRMEITDWNAYNMAHYQGLDGQSVRPVSDLRVSAGIEATQAGFETTFELEARSHLFRFTLRDGEARMAFRRVDDPDGPWTERTVPFTMPAPGTVFDVEFWHVDQAMWMFVDGASIMEPLTYDWGPAARLAAATGKPESTFATTQFVAAEFPPRALPPELRWRFSGSPVTLRRVHVDRDLHYRAEFQGLRDRSRAANATHPSHLAMLGPDHFLVLGDNSPASNDSRLWAPAAPLVRHQIDDAQYVVHRKLLLGKAWAVYFPSPLRIWDGLPRLMPDFGRLRFIR